ncbi:MAG: TIGR04442 family protein [Proteobacteria bacterium]|nr:TIGR04442 family protein [Pseudomonadota bacterium]
MLKKLIFEGVINHRVSYTFYAYGEDVYSRVFYQYDKDSGIERFFSKGFGFTVFDDRIAYRGFGGSFCNYMFGVERPFKDLIKPEVKNRLIMFGATQRDSETIEFTDLISGEESYLNIFSEGNAVTNYFFMVIDKKEHKNIGKRQEEILKKLGKTLKRTELVKEENDLELIKLIHTVINEKDVLIILFKVYDILVKSLWNLLSKGELTVAEQERMKEIEKHLEKYQIERIRVESIYQNEENQNMVNEYVSLLLKREKNMSEEDESRLKKLRLSLIRNGIPESILDGLERSMKTTAFSTRTEDIKEILDSFISTGIISDEDIIRLILAKRKSLVNRDMSFEQTFLDAGRIIDEKVSKEGDFLLMEGFNKVITYFDRFDTTYQLLTKISFVPETEITENHLRSLIGNYKVFEELKKGLFFEVFFSDLYRDPYLTNYGKKRLSFLEKQIPLIVSDETMLTPSFYALKNLMQEEIYFYKIIRIIKENFWEVFSLWGEKDLDMDYYISKVQERLKEELGEDVYIPKYLWQEVFWHIKKEVFFITQVLPKISEEKNLELKEDFIANSGIDRFYAEELEKSYYSKHGIR